MVVLIQVEPLPGPRPAAGFVRFMG
jgi:hypothetical protein